MCKRTCSRELCVLHGARSRLRQGAPLVAGDACGLHGALPHVQEAAAWPATGARGAALLPGQARQRGQACASACAAL